MKKIFELFIRKKDTPRPLFQIRRHTFEYWWKQAKKRKKYKLIRNTFHPILIMNPYKLRVFLIIFMGIIISFGIILSFNLSIRDIYITRENSLIDINEAYRNLEYLRGKSMIHLQKDNIITRLQSSQSVIQDVYVKRRFPRAIEVHIVPYRPLFQSSEGLIMTSGNIFWTDSERITGIPWLDVSWYEPSLLNSGPDFSLSDLRNIIQLINELEKNIVWLRINGKKYYIKEREIHLRDNSGTIYLFDLTHSIALQTEKLAIYFREKEKNPSQRDMTYIDVRVPRWLFVCSLTEESVCMRNMRNIYWEKAEDFSIDILEDITWELTQE